MENSPHLRLVNPYRSLPDLQKLTIQVPSSLYSDLFLRILPGSIGALQSCGATFFKEFHKALVLAIPDLCYDPDNIQIAAKLLQNLSFNERSESVPCPRCSNPSPSKSKVKTTSRKCKPGGTTRSSPTGENPSRKTYEERNDNPSETQTS